MTESSETTVILGMLSSWSPSAGGECRIDVGIFFYQNTFTVTFSSSSSSVRANSSHHGKLALCLREIPLELRQRTRGGQVNLDMEDHRDEDFTKPKPTFKAFTGEGQKLGR